ncbi:MAG: AAA family ATPase [Phycisphaerales bacterium]|nr:AAA family ATPase [Phycisphaerales bacterium]
MTDQERLTALLNAEYPCVRMVTTEEDEARRLVASVFVNRGKPLWVWSASAGLKEALVSGGQAVANTQHPAAACAFLRDGVWEVGEGVVFLDVAGHLTDPRTMREIRELLDLVAKGRGCMIFIDANELPEVLKQSSVPFDLSLPQEAEIERIVKELLRTRRDGFGIQVQITGRDFETIIRNLRGLTRRQVRQVILDAIATDRKFTAEDLNTVLAAKRRFLAGDGMLEYVEAPAHIDEIGGMRNLKEWLARRQGALSTAAVEFGLTPPRGLFMLGVQGAGKSLAAKAVATAWGRPLLKMDPGVLFDRYIGESERRLRSALKQAEAMAPIVLWIDEIEKGFASAASQSVDGGLSKRMLGTLLTWMQEHKDPVFLIATANDIESLPPELLRKGRFDEIFFVDLPNTEARAEIFKIHLTKRNRNLATFDIPTLANASEGYSGAEIEQAVVTGLFDAFSVKLELSTNILLAAMRKSPPLSVTMAEKMELLRAWARGRCVPAD